MKKIHLHGASALICAAAMFFSCSGTYDVAVIGGGASGVAAALQAARSGARVVLVQDQPWLGGMLTSSGVSAVDGNYNLRGGIFGEFCDSLALRYATVEGPGAMESGYSAMRSGWVSNILFEPHVGAEVFANMVAAEQGITLCPAIRGVRHKARITIDCTELGDVAKSMGVEYDLGGDDGSGVIQDLTWVAVLKDYGPDADMTIEKPSGYRREDYVNSCLNPLNTSVFEKGQQLWSPEMMISYGRLPGGKKFMINWPVEGNDFYLNVVDSTASARERCYEAAKERTLGFVYFIQTELGMRNLGLADDEFPQLSGVHPLSGMAYQPYNRESRRIKGEVRFEVEAASDPYNYRFPLYRTGIAVGDYAVDHHHFQHPDWKNLPKHIFAPILAYTTPLGCIIPKGNDELLVAEKSISVSSIMNGTTRLQPVVMELGQAAGELAAQAVRRGIAPREVAVRDVQDALLESGCYIMAFRDVPVTDPNFRSYQRIGATGILRGSGEYIDWQNRLWLRVNDPLLWDELYLDEYYGIPHDSSRGPVTRDRFMSLMQRILAGRDEAGQTMESSAGSDVITRGEAAVILDAMLDPFHSVGVDFYGRPEL